MAEDFKEQINQSSRGWVKAMGLVFTEATVERVRCEWEVGEQHLQPYGIVHGGVHTGVVETVASIGAHLVATQRGQRAVGLENHTSFLRAVRSGKLRAEAIPLTVGRTSHVWEATITDAEGKLVARGTVRILCVDEDRKLAGQV